MNREDKDSSGGSAVTIVSRHFSGQTGKTKQMSTAKAAARQRYSFRFELCTTQRRWARQWS